MGGAPMGKSAERNGDPPDDGPKGGRKSELGGRKRLRSSLKENVGS